ncbi:MAG: transposase [Ignavibacteriae bacterium]|nr:transposase [Ignavibacteriota bacterium]
MREGLEWYLTFYNTKRKHQALGYRTPHEAFLERLLPTS